MTLTESAGQAVAGARKQLQDFAMRSLISPHDRDAGKWVGKVKHMLREVEAMRNETECMRKEIEKIGIDMEAMQNDIEVMQIDSNGIRWSHAEDMRRNVEDMRDATEGMRTDIEIMQNDTESVQRTDMEAMRQNIDKVRDGIQHTWEAFDRLRSAVEDMRKAIEIVWKRLTTWDQKTNVPNTIENHHKNWHIARMNAARVPLDPHTVLAPLLDVRTGEPIVDFPKSKADLMAMDGKFPAVEYKRLLTNQQRQD